jgi:long-chain acyl-CoA synthetase
MTECAPLISYSPYNEFEPGTCGKVLDGMDARIDNPDPHTGIGELLVKGENVMQGYYRDPELTRGVFTDDGRFRTGDLGCFDKQRCFYLKGRLKNMILSANGENIYPEDIESVINSVRGVLESVVLEKKGRLVAMVCLNMDELENNYLQIRSNTMQYISDKKEEWTKQKKELDKYVEHYIARLKEYVNHRLNRFSKIHSIIVVPDPFEKTPTQKIKRYLYS